MTRKPRPVDARVTLRERLIVYFALNPDEQLMLVDIAAKFRRSVEGARWATKKMADAGLLVSSGGYGQIVISIGPELSRMIAPHRTATADSGNGSASVADDLQSLRAALQEADTLAGHDDALTEWRDKWAHLWRRVEA
jgi:hypothetical protein